MESNECSGGPPADYVFELIADVDAVESSEEGSYYPKVRGMYGTTEYPEISFSAGDAAVQTITVNGSTDDEFTVSSDHQIAGDPLTVRVIK